MLKNQQESCHAVLNGGFGKRAQTDVQARWNDVAIRMMFQVALPTFEVRVESSVLCVEIEVCKDMARRVGARSGHCCGHGRHRDCCCQAGGQVAVRCVLPCPADCGGCRAVTCIIPCLSSSLVIDPK